VFFRFCWCAAATVAVCLSLTRPEVQAAEALTIGSNAPPLNVEHWIQDGGGKFKPVTKFEPGKVYVIEFWATWCGPCVASMPHLAELQKEYADKGVQIVSVSDEDLETVEGFLERPVRGAEGGAKTYRDLTKAWCLTTDPDGSTYKDYMTAAGQNGIPTSFVVGKDSKIEWIGHPMQLDEVLAQVVDGKWDRDAFGAEFKAQQAMQLAQAEIAALLEKGDIDAVVRKIDELSKDVDDIGLQIFKLQVLLRGKKSDEAATLLKKLYAKGAEDPAMVDMLAWNVYEMGSQLKLLNAEMIDASISATEAAAKKAEDELKSSLLDTLAHYYFAKGDLDKAIAAEEKAIAVGDGRNREFYENFLQELKEAKAKKSESAKPQK
jgi:thiol-disulfide isomerase/thioredoxin